MDDPEKLETPAVESAELSVPEGPPADKDTNQPAEPEDDHEERSPHADGECKIKAEEGGDVKESLENKKHEEETKAAFVPPVNPPPPPNTAQKRPGEEASLTGGMSEENGEVPFFQIATPAKPPVTPSEEEDEDEMSLKGRPPPTPLFGDDEDDEDDLDWLN